jgi:hypothetical protein
MASITPDLHASTAGAHGLLPAAGAVGRGGLLAGGLAGFIAVVAGFAGGPDDPALATATALQLRDHAVQQGGAIQISAATSLIALAATLVFVAALARQVRDRLPQSLLPDLVLLSGALVLVYQLLYVAGGAVIRLLPNLVESDLASTDDSLLRGWFAVTGFVHFVGDLVVVPLAVLMGAFSLAALRGGLLPRWLAWAGLVLAGCGLLGAAGVVTEIDALYVPWFVALIGYFVWMLALAVTFLLRARRSRPATT